ncbi:hypothetical protein [Candidatus Sororendozoicomonas aggregata]|uniref:hypothetical protein n=1 Tax=Candidatus Sororendozoicomonas aggregata TaxID=3073239 RepID=UPI002ED27B4D
MSAQAITKTHRRNCQQRFISNALTLASHAVECLQRQGFTVESVDVSQGQPRIRIGYERNCILLGQPVVSNRQQQAVYRVQFRHCQVSWLGQ